MTRINKFFCIVSLVFALMIGGVNALADINVPSEIEPHVPIVIDFSAPLPKDAEIKYIWTISEPAAHIVSDKGDKVYVWAKPGRYSVGLTVVWMQTKEISLAGEKIKVLLGWDLKNYNKYFVVQDKDGPDPNPNPNPNPNPTGFGKMVFDSLEKVSSVVRNKMVDVRQADGNILQRKSQDVVKKNYADIAKEAEKNPDSWDAATMVNEVKVRNISSLPTDNLKGWNNFWPGLGEAFRSLKLESTDLEGHIKAFKEVAEILGG